MPERPACRPVHARRLGPLVERGSACPSWTRTLSRPPHCGNTGPKTKCRMSEPDTSWRLPGSRRWHFSGNFRRMPAFKNQWQISGSFAPFATEVSAPARGLKITKLLIYNDLPLTRGTDCGGKSAFGT